MLLRVLFGLSFLVLSFAMPPARAQELTVAAAADLRPALEEIASRFHAVSDAEVKLVYGSSGNFYQQIQNGAPFNFLFSANADYPKKLQQRDLPYPEPITSMLAAR